MPTPSRIHNHSPTLTHTHYTTRTHTRHTRHKAALNITSPARSRSVQGERHAHVAHKQALHQLARVRVVHGDERADNGVDPRQEALELRLRKRADASQHHPNERRKPAHFVVKRRVQRRGRREAHEQRAVVPGRGRRQRRQASLWRARLRSGGAAHEAREGAHQRRRRVRRRRVLGLLRPQRRCWTDGGASLRERRLQLRHCRPGVDALLAAADVERA
mmetsp:Transcript_10479/g.31594  ORF Transcript_10479/g.31594 Transcript_10479/m.31594 type:complete len:218 (+) Transcript_10479:754-1407(+)